METIRKKRFVLYIYRRLTDVRVKPTALHQIRRIDWSSLVVIPLVMNQCVIGHQAIYITGTIWHCTHFLHNPRFKIFQTLLRTWQFRWKILENGIYMYMLHIMCTIFLLMFHFCFSFLCSFFPCCESFF